MADLDIGTMMKLQDELQEKYRGKWEPIAPEKGHLSMLWMMEELGEVVSVYKKRGDRAIMEDPAVRAHFIEEMSDVLMFFMDLLQCYRVTPEEFTRAYLEKHARNMDRDFVKEHRNYLNEETAD